MAHKHFRLPNEWKWTLLRFWMSWHQYSYSWITVDFTLLFYISESFSKSFLPTVISALTPWSFENTAHTHICYILLDCSRNMSSETWHPTPPPHFFLPTATTSLLLNQTSKMQMITATQSGIPLAVLLCTIQCFLRLALNSVGVHDFLIWGTLFLIIFIYSEGTEQQWCRHIYH